MEILPKISIIVPVYNVEAYLHQCVNSLINQSLKEIEVILIDDESSDKSSQICDEFAKKDSRVKVIHKKNEGQGIGRNYGINIAIGEYVTFVDSDDCVSLNTYDVAYSYAKEYDLDIMRYDCDRFSDDDIVKYENQKGDFIIIDNSEDIRQAALCLFSKPINTEDKNIDLGGSACMAIYKHELLEKNNIRFVSERVLIGEDSLFNYDCLQFAQRIGRISAPFYHYRINMNSFSRSIKFDGLRKNIYFVKHMTGRFKNDNYPSNSELYAMGYYVQYIRIYILQVLGSNVSFKKKKEWFMKELPSEYLEYVKEKYPWRKLPFKSRLLFMTAINNNYMLAYVLANINKYINILSNKII